MRAKLSISSCFEELSRLRTFVRDFCKDKIREPYDEETIWKLELAAHEAAANVIEHAYDGHKEQRLVIEIELTGAQILLKIFHFGKPFSPPAKPSSCVENLQNRGYGLTLLEESMDEVKYLQDEKGENCIYLLKNLSN